MSTGAWLSRPDKYAALRGRVQELFEEGGRNWGYRTIWARLRREGGARPKVVRRLMREENRGGLQQAARSGGGVLLRGEVSAAPPNLVARDFSAAAPTGAVGHRRHRVPRARRQGLPERRGGLLRRPPRRLADRPQAHGLARQRVAARRPRGQAGGARTVVHSDRGGHYRWRGGSRSAGARTARSMSAKGCSPDNAACEERFFRRLKNEFFHYRDWEGVSLAEFSERLDAYLRYYCSGRIKRSLGWLARKTPAGKAGRRGRYEKRPHPSVEKCQLKAEMVR